MGNCFWWDGGDQFQNLIGLGISMMSKMMVQMIQTMFFFFCVLGWNLAPFHFARFEEFFLALQEAWMEI